MTLGKASLDAGMPKKLTSEVERHLKQASAFDEHREITPQNSSPQSGLSAALFIHY